MVGRRTVFSVTTVVVFSEFRPYRHCRIWLVAVWFEPSFENVRTVGAAHEGTSGT